MFYLSRSEQIALFALIALLLGGCGLLIYARGQHAAASGSGQPLFAPVAAETAASGEVVVHVTGAVSRPGVYHLPAGSRIADALDRAGGATPQAELTVLNLAARLQDGAQITVPVQGQVQAPERATPAAPSAGGRLSLNRATAAELESLPGIGPVYAQRIIAYREQKMRQEGHGFESVDELLNIAGIGPKRLAALRDCVVP